MKIQEFVSRAPKIQEVFDQKGIFGLSSFQKSDVKLA